DALSRLTYKDLPGSEPDVSHAYDLLGRPTSVSQSGHSLGFTYDALGRPLTQSGPQGAVTSTFDVAGRRTRITHSDGFWAITRTSSPERCTRCANIAPRAASPGRWGNMPIVPAPRLATVAPNSGKALRRMKFSYSAVWNDTAALLRSHFSTALALAGAFIFLPALLVGHFLQQPLPGEDLNAYLAEFQEYLVSNAPWLLLQALVNALGTIAILMLVFAPRGTRVGAVLGAALALLPFYFVAGLIANLIVFAGVLLFIVPGLYLFGRLVPLGPAVAAENRRNPLKALGRAIELTRGHGWAVLGLVLLVGIPGLILMQVVNLLFGILFRILAGDEVATLLQLIVTSATAAALTIVLLLLYAGVYRALSARDQGRPPTEGT
ncbi:MAG TPA: RHS repeat domain-containing protein, partial [Allosphingosinicella sp.]